jgi:uncharacterized protein (DUF1800 family)
MGETIPSALTVATKEKIDPHFHLLSRAAYGPWPGDVDYLKEIGKKAWLEEQLNYETIKDDACNLRAKRFESLHLDPGTCYEFKKPVITRELAGHAILRAVYSKRQLYEVMVGFWSDHLNISVDKGDCAYFKAFDDRKVIRPHALGKFRDLIKASVLSPAMLVYLDGKENKKPKPDSIPNENAARELLELHTLGVHGGYSQRDVYEVARCLTGWTIQTGWSRGKEIFQQPEHDNGQKLVLGHKIPAGLCEKDVDAILDILCVHPSTAAHIAQKLVRKFVSDDPPDSLVSKIAHVFLSTKGDIKSMLSAIFTSTEFEQARGLKLKRPFHYIVSALRMCGADTFAHEQLLQYISRMGQSPFAYPTPDGYPDKPEPWLGTLLWRWNFAQAMATNGVPSVSVDFDKLKASLLTQTTVQVSVRSSPESRSSQITAERKGLLPTELDRNLIAYFTGRRASAAELQALETYRLQRSSCSDGEIVGLILASPAFQRC